MTSAESSFPRKWEDPSAYAAFTEADYNDVLNLLEAVDDERYKGDYPLGGLWVTSYEE